MFPLFLSMVSTYRYSNTYVSSATISFSCPVHLVCVSPSAELEREDTFFRLTVDGSVGSEFQ